MNLSRETLNESFLPRVDAGYRLLDVGDAGVVRRSRAGSGPEELAIAFGYGDIVSLVSAWPDVANRT
jgi:hypothetical protein